MARQKRSLLLIPGRIDLPGLLPLYNELNMLPDYRQKKPPEHHSPPYAAPSSRIFMNKEG